MPIVSGRALSSNIKRLFDRPGILSCIVARSKDILGFRPRRRTFVPARAGIPFESYHVGRFQMSAWDDSKFPHMRTIRPLRADFVPQLAILCGRPARGVIGGPKRPGGTISGVFRIRNSAEDFKQGAKTQGMSSVVRDQSAPSLKFRCAKPLE